DFIVLAAYMIFWFVREQGFSVWEAFLITLPAMALVGFLLQVAFINRALKTNDLLVPLLVTFGIAIIIQDGLREYFTTNSRSFALDLGSLPTRSVPIFGIQVGELSILVFLAAIAVLAVLSYIFYRTRLGRLLRATSDSAETIQLMGVNPRWIYAIAM